MEIHHFAISGARVICDTWPVLESSGRTAVAQVDLNYLFSNIFKLNLVNFHRQWQKETLFSFKKWLDYDSSHILNHLNI